MVKWRPFGRVNSVTFFSNSLRSCAGRQEPHAHTMAKRKNAFTIQLPTNFKDIRAGARPFSSRLRLAGGRGRSAKSWLACYNRPRVMATDGEQPKMTVEELAARFHGQMIPITRRFSYFSTLPVAEEDLRQY